MKWTAHASLPVVWIPVLSKDLPCPQRGYDRFLIILTSRKQPWKYNFVWGFYAYWDLWKSRKQFPFMKFIPSVGWRMSAVKSGSSPTVLHLSPPPFCSRPKLIASRTKSAEKSIYEIKNRIYEKDPLNCWYSMQNRRKQNRITKSQQTFFDFFSQNRGYFPLFLLINIWNTISCRSGTAHPQRLRALLTGHNIYMYQIYRGTHRGATLCVFTIQSTLFHSIFESRICK